MKLIAHKIGIFYNVYTQTMLKNVFLYAIKDVCYSKKGNKIIRYTHLFVFLNVEIQTSI